MLYSSLTIGGIALFARAVRRLVTMGGRPAVWRCVAPGTVVRTPTADMTLKTASGDIKVPTSQAHILYCVIQR